MKIQYISLSIKLRVKHVLILVMCDLPNCGALVCSQQPAALLVTGIYSRKLLRVESVSCHVSCDVTLDTAVTLTALMVPTILFPLIRADCPTFIPHFPFKC